MVHYNQRYAFVSSARLDFQAGAGSSPVVLGLMAALARKGKNVALVAPAPLRLPSALLAVWFNSRVARTLGALEMDVAVGFGGDGFRFARARRKSRFVAFLGEVTPDRTESALALRRRERIACQSGDLVVVTSQYARRRISAAYALPEAQIAVVPCGVDTEEWSRRALPEHDRPRVLAIAKGASAADLEWLLSSVVRLRESGQDVELHLAGGEQNLLRRHSALALKCGSSIMSMPAQSKGLRRSDLKAEIGACDLYVQISSSAGLAPHPLWAMATGRPVIAPKAVDFPEIVGHGGVLVPPGDSEALGQAMTDILGARTRQREWASRARQRALELSWDASASSFGELLAGL